jgi:hypothetical protein
VLEGVLAEIGLETRRQISFFCEMEARRSFIVNLQEYREGRERIKGEIGRMMSVDPTAFGEQLRIISQVYTYFSIASRRVIETVPMICEISFAKGFGQQLRKEFTRKLGLLGPDGLEVCTRFAREDTAIGEKRKKLLADKKIVDESLKVLDSAVTMT